MSNKQFRDWAEKVVRQAMVHQDLTFQQMLEKNIIVSWAEWVLRGDQL